MSAQLESVASSIPSIPLEQLRPSTTEAQSQRRKHFDKAKLAELAESIATHGVLQPIIVRRVNGEKAAGVTVPEYFEIVAGERRVRAAQQAGHVRIPANVLELTDEQVVEVQLIENLQREDVHPMQEAEGYHELVRKYGHPIEAVYTKVCKSRGYVYARMKLLDLCTEARDAFYKTDIDQSRALLIARIPGEEQQQRALKQITEKRWDGEGLRMSYREAQRYVHETFMLKLSTAPFARDDATLVPSAGACGPCPMRTGNAPDLFDDVKGADVCTNPTCFSAKKAAHVKRELEKARVDGAEIIRGANAKRILPDSRYTVYGGPEAKQLRNGYARPRDKCLDDPKKRTYAELAGKDAPTVLLQHPDTGRVEKVIRLEDVADRLKEKGIKHKTPETTKEAQGQSEEKRRQREELEIAARRKIFQAIVEAAPTKLDTDDLVAIATNQFEFHGNYNGDDQGVYAALGWDLAKCSEKDFEARLRKEPATRLVQIVIAMSVVEDALGTWQDPDQLNALAKRLGVDVKKIRRELEPAAEAKPGKASTKKAAKRKAK